MVIFLTSGSGDRRGLAWLKKGSRVDPSFLDQHLEEQQQMAELIRAIRERDERETAARRSRREKWVQLHMPWLCGSATDVVDCHVPPPIFIPNYEDKFGRVSKSDSIGSNESGDTENLTSSSRQSSPKATQVRTASDPLRRVKNHRKGKVMPYKELKEEP